MVNIFLRLLHSTTSHFNHSSIKHEHPSIKQFKHFNWNLCISTTWWYHGWWWNSGSADGEWWVYQRCNQCWVYWYGFTGEIHLVHQLVDSTGSSSGWHPVWISANNDDPNCGVLLLLVFLFLFLRLRCLLLLLWHDVHKQLLLGRLPFLDETTKWSNERGCLMVGQWFNGPTISVRVRCSQ